MIYLHGRIPVPWNVGWTDEQRYEIRPCRHVGGRLAIWMPHNPGGGQPVFAKPHTVRQRKSIAEFICTVCGEHTPEDDRWWFALGTVMTEKAFKGWFSTTESPVHKACADLALTVCPHLQRRGAGRDLTPFPKGWRVLSSLVGGSATDDDFAVKINGRNVVGHLKFAWPPHAIKIEPRLEKTS